MHKRQTRSAKVQKAADPQHLPKQQPVRQPKQGPVQMVAPQVVYQRAQESRGELQSADVLALQRTVGNRRVLQIVAPAPIVQRYPKGKSPNPSPPSPELLFAMIMATTLDTPKLAREAMAAFKKMKPAQQKKNFDSFYRSGDITKMLKMLPPKDATGIYRNELIKILRWIEETETLQIAGVTEERLAKTQQKWMTAKAEQDAKAKLSSNGVKRPPTPTELEEARKAAVEKTSIQPATTNRWRTMKPSAKKQWKKDAKVAVKAVVAWAAKSYPELSLTQKHFVIDPDGIEKRGQGILAMGGVDSAGKDVAIVGIDFINTAKQNPDYVISTVVHEVFGHPEYGEYGKEYHLALYRRAAKKMKGYKKPKPGSQAESQEIDAYAYQETEIYSLLRELPYFPAAAAKTNPNLAQQAGDPTPMIDDHVATIKEQWEPSIAAALLHGLYQRFVQDPRLQKVAIQAFCSAVKNHFPKELGQILK